MTVLLMLFRGGQAPPRGRPCGRTRTGAGRTLRALAAPGEGIGVRGRAAYLHTPEGFGTSRLAARLDKGIGVPSTARNWNTVVKLMELADRAASREDASEACSR